MNVCVRNTFISLWLLFGALSLSAQGAGFYFPVINNAASGSNKVMPLKVLNLDSVVSMQMAFRWDPKVLKYLTIDNFNFSDLGLADFNTTRALDSGYVRLQWEAPSSASPGFSVPDSSTIFRFRFNLIGEDSTCSTVLTTELLSFPPTYFEIVKVRADGTNEDYVLSECTFSQGRICIGITSSAQEPADKEIPVSIFPNPFLVSGQFQFELDETADTQLFITDSKGQKIFEKQFFQLPAGQHGMVIENSMLGAPGVYALTLQAGRKIVTRSFVLL